MEHGRGKMDFNAFSTKQLFAILMLLCSFTFYAQNDSLPPLKREHGSWTKHHVVFSAGIGNYRIDPYKYYHVSVGSSTVTNLSATPIHVKGDFAYNDHFGFGLSITQSRIYYTTSYYYMNPYSSSPTLKTDEVSLKIFTVNFRLNYHLLHNKAFDPYFGIGAGIRTYNYSGAEGIENAFLTKQSFGFELTAGCRYLVASRVGVYIEAGIAASVYQMGLSVNVGKLRKTRLNSTI